MKILDISNLYFQYPPDSGRTRFTLSIEKLFIDKGTNLALFGRSGSGKSTILKICAGLQKDFNGRIEIFGEKLNGRSNGSRARSLNKTAILFQDAPLFNCSVYENIAIGLRINKADDKYIKKTVNEIIEKMNINSIAHAGSREISGGQARRVCLARVLALKPELLFLDEPFYSLDSVNRSLIINELKHLCEDEKITLMLVTHDKNEVLALCKNLAVIENGAIIRCGPAIKCFNNPQSETETGLFS